MKLWITFFLGPMLLVAVHCPIVFRTAPCRSEPKDYNLQGSDI